MREAPPAGAGLQRIFGLGFGLAVVIGGVIGSGVMRNPGVVAKGFPTPALAVAAWIAGGAVIALEAASTVELGAAVPEDGGPYPLAARALGPSIGFFVGWADWLQIAVSTGFIAVAFGEYVNRLGFFASAGPAAPALVLILACGLVSALGARSGGFVQNLGSALKALGLFALIAALAFGRSAPVAGPPAPAFSLAAAALALRAVYGAYGGWHSPVYFSEEVHRPEHNIARSTFCGILLVTLLYVFVNAAIFKALPLGVVAASSLPAADAARAVLGPAGGLVVTALAIVAVASLVNLQTMALVRTTFALARKGVLPAPLARVSTNGTPLLSLAVSVAAGLLVVGAAAVVKGPLYEILLNVYAPFPAFIFLMLAVGAIRLRLREPDLPRPWRMPLFPLPALVGALANLLLLGLFLVSDPKTGVIAAALLAAGAPLLWRSRRPRSPPLVSTAGGGQSGPP